MFNNIIISLPPGTGSADFGPVMTNYFTEAPEHSELPHVN